MKNKIIIAAAAAVALASCTKDNVIDMNRGDVINFRTSVGVSSKATDKTSFSSGDTFKALATYDNNGVTSVYFNENFRFDGSGWYSVTTPYYWPSEMDAFHTLTFEAVWPSSLETALGTSAFDYSAPEAVDSQLDILYAKHVSTSRETSGVKLNFRHTLAQIAVKARNGSSTVECDVTGVKLAFINKAGSFNPVSVASGNTDDNNAGNLARTDWTLTDGSVDASSDYVQDGIDIKMLPQAAAATIGESVILIPQTKDKASAYTSSDAGARMNGAYIAVKMTIRNAADGTVIASERWCCWPVAIDWVPGYKYTYTIDLSAGGYEDGNDDGDDDLDPVLENQEIFFVDCSVDAWDGETHEIAM